MRREGRQLRLLQAREHIFSRQDDATYIILPLEPRFAKKYGRRLRESYNVNFSDTGSPLICEGGVLCGIMSWDFECDTNIAPSVFAEVSHFADWFIENTQ